MNDEKQFIEDAIKGGWKTRPEKAIPRLIGIFPTEYDGEVAMFETKFIENAEENERHWSHHVNQITSDPLAWQAVGKTREWPSKMCLNCGEVNLTICCDGAKTYGWGFMMHRFLGALIEGKSINQSLKEIN